MSADPSQNAPSGNPTSEDTSRPESPLPVPVLAPGNNDTPPTPSPSEATTGLPTTGLDGGTDAGVDNDDYAALKAAFLAGDSATPVGEVSAPEVAPAPPQPPAPVEPEVDDKTGNPRFPNLRVRPSSEQDLQILDQWKAHQASGHTTSLVEFILAQNKAPAAPAAPVAPEPLPPATEQTQSEGRKSFSTVEEIDAEIQRLTDLEYEELGNFNPQEAKKHRLAVQALLAQRPHIENAIQQAGSLQEQAALQEWNQDVAKAQTIFADAGKPGPLEDAAAQVRAQWVQNNHPLAYSSQSALALYAEAAALIGYKPQSSVAAPPPTPSPLSTPASVHRPPAAIIAGGDARSHTTRTPDPRETGLDAYESEKAALLKSRQ